VPAGAGFSVQCLLENRGSRRVDEVVQIYLSATDVIPDAPRWTLCAFRRVHIEPGTSIHIRETLEPTAITTVDATGHRAIRPGRYRVAIGGSSPCARSQALGAPKPLIMEFNVVETQE
jgi:beta-glucosidase